MSAPALLVAAKREHDGGHDDDEASQQAEGEDDSSRDAAQAEERQPTCWPVVAAHEGDEVTAVQVKALRQIETARVAILSIGYRAHSVTCYFADGGVATIAAGTARALRRRGRVDWNLDGDRWVVKVTK